MIDNENMKIKEMLDEDLYWAIIEKSLQNSDNQDTQEEILIKELGNLTPKEILGFRLRTDKLLNEIYTFKMCCAGYIMNDEYCSDDGFEYFRCWVISRGKDVYYNAKQNPDTLIDEVSEDMEYYEFETFGYVAHTVFEDKTGKESYDYIEYDNSNIAEEFEFNGEENTETIKKICPQLFEKFLANK